MWVEVQRVSYTSICVCTFLPAITLECNISCNIYHFSGCMCILSMTYPLAAYNVHVHVYTINGMQLGSPVSTARERKDSVR